MIRPTAFQLAIAVLSARKTMDGLGVFEIEDDTLVTIINDVLTTYLNSKPKKLSPEGFDADGLIKALRQCHDQI